MKKTPVFNLDAEEREISEGLERLLEEGKLKSVRHAKKKIALAKEAAVDFRRKNARVSICLTSDDLIRLKRKAAYKGLPYQVFIASVLHEYAAGHFE